MSDLYVIGYPSVQRAQEVRARLLEMQRENLIEIEDAVVVENQDGKIKLRQSLNTTGASAAAGALWGGLIGLLFLMPLLGMAAGAGVGAARGALVDEGIDDRFMKRLGTTLPAGGAALFLLVRKVTQDKVLADLAPMGGELIKTSLTADAEEALQSAIRTARSA